MRNKGVAGRAVLGCLAAAGIALAVFGLWGDVRAGAAVAAGLVLGSANGLAAERAFGHGLSLRLSSLPRLALLSGAVVASGFLLGLPYTWVVALGAAAAQLILAGFAARSLLAR